MERLVADRYRLRHALGSGGMGTVWRATDELLHRDVAVKEVVLPAGLPEGEQDELRERTLREARAAARLDSPHAVTVYDVVEDEGHAFLVMELVEARTLSQVVKQDGPLPPDRVAQIGLDVLSALDAAHAEGIVHRDVKPSNVLVCPDGRTVLSDFGIAHATGESSLTSTGLLLGSPAYIAPERARGLQPGPASDLWSLGATLFTAVEGRPPFDTGNPLTTLTAVVAGDAAPTRLAGPLAPVLDGLLARDPQDRLDAGRTRTALTAILDAGAAPHPTVALPLPAAPVERAEEVVAVRPVRDHRRGVGAAAAALLVAVAATVGFLASNRPDSSGTARATTSPSAAAVPADWQTVTGDGWTLRVPPGWERSTFKGTVQLKDPETRRTVRVGRADLAAGPLPVLRTTATAFAASHTAYHQLRLEEQGDGAVWELTYTDSGADLHAADHALVVDGKGFTVFTQTRQADWAAAQEQLATVLGSLRAG